MTILGTRRLEQLRDGMTAARRREGRPSVSPATAAIVLDLIGELERTAARVARLEKLDREAATHVESVICLRTHFTGSPPYVGWRGLGLALSEALDERDLLRTLHRPEDGSQPLQPSDGEGIVAEGQDMPTEYKDLPQSPNGGGA